MKTGSATQKKLSASIVDFPRINESYTGRFVEWNIETVFAEIFSENIYFFNFLVYLLSLNRLLCL